jgi:hypothetical protein
MLEGVFVIAWFLHVPLHSAMGVGSILLHGTACFLFAGGALTCLGSRYTSFSQVAFPFIVSITLVAPGFGMVTVLLMIGMEKYFKVTPKKESAFVLGDPLLQAEEGMDDTPVVFRSHHLQYLLSNSFQFSSLLFFCLPFASLFF